MARLFGTDGIRGEANRYPMSPDLLVRLGQALGLYFKPKSPHPKILIGKDTRRSGYMLEQALAAGISSVGVEVGFLGPLPTPGIAYLTRGLRASAGVVISASHNPYPDNGIKIFKSDGYKLPDAAEDQIEALLFRDFAAEDYPTGHLIGSARRIDDAIGQYAVFLKEQFPKSLTLEGMRIVLDCAHGAAYRVAPKVFEELGAEVFAVGIEPNGRNINEDCGALHPQKLTELVHLYKADLGIALDGDADRIVIVDDRAEVVHGDQLIGIFAQYLHEKGRLKGGGVVATVMSNMGLDLALAELGLIVQRTKVGDRYVMESMRKGSFNLGGEPSGHMILKDSSTTGDGILAALLLLEIMQETQKPVSTLRGVVELLPQVLKNIRVSQKVPVEKLPDLQTQIRDFEADLAQKGRILFRYSGTENLARVMVEGEDPTLIERMASELIETASQAISEYEGLEGRS